MTDTPRDQGDDLRERLARAVQHTLNITAWVDTTDDNSDAARELAHAITDALLPVVTAHTDAALAEQREQIIAAIEAARRDGLTSAVAQGAMVRAADIVREVGKP